MTGPRCWVYEKQSSQSSAPMRSAASSSSFPVSLSFATSPESVLVTSGSASVLYSSKSERWPKRKLNSSSSSFGQWSTMASTHAGGHTSGARFRGRFHDFERSFDLPPRGVPRGPPGGPGSFTVNSAVIGGFLGIGKPYQARELCATGQPPRRARPLRNGQK